MWYRSIQSISVEMESTTSPTFIWASRIHFLTRAERPLPGAAAGRGGGEADTDFFSFSSSPSLSLQPVGCLRRSGCCYRRRRRRRLRAASYLPPSADLSLPLGRRHRRLPAPLPPSSAVPNALLTGRGWPASRLLSTGSVRGVPAE